MHAEDCNVSHPVISNMCNHCGSFGSDAHEVQATAHIQEPGTRAARQGRIRRRIARPTRQELLAQNMSLVWENESLKRYLREMGIISERKRFYLACSHLIGMDPKKRHSRC